PGEKSPGHIRHVQTLLNLYPKSRIICVTRDGRDVVLSLLKVPWAEPDNPRRFRLFCMEWADLARLVLNFKNTLPKDRFTIVRYEDMLNHPENELARLCSFIGVKFEPGQLHPQESSTVVPVWEKQWKGNASQKLDKSRIEAWRKGTQKSKIMVMNSMMGRMLKKMGYKDTSLYGCSAGERLVLLIAKLPYLGPFRKISLSGLKVLRKLDFLKQKG
ncbi:MAG: sulfotransferase, partial [Desulfobacteraceae bacterium]|nr:sulfotransferase [Desulfobacteraceae bacterium]